MHSIGSIPTSFQQTAKRIAVVAARKFYGSSYRLHKEKSRQTEKSTTMKAEYFSPSGAYGISAAAKTSGLLCKKKTQI
jgi:hypothetical protein